MAGGLVGLFDDIAALAKLAAASVDDVGLAAGRASAKAAGVVVDDTAVTPAYVQGLAAEREIPIIKKIAKGSLRNKLLLILPAALILSAIAPTLVEVILMLGGTFLCFEGAEKLYHRFVHDDHGHDVPAVVMGPEAEAAVVSGAVRTDLILSAEIMVIALKDVIDEPIVARAVILVIVAVLITVIVYGIVALIVKMDDAGLALAGRESPKSQKLGRTLVAAMPKLLAGLAAVGTAAMLWVGGHILLVGSDELGWHGPYKFVHRLEEEVHGVAGIGGVLGWLVNTTMSAIVGLIVGALVVAVVLHIKKRRSPTSTGEAAHN
jgi:uncharacterized protein